FRLYDFNILSRSLPILTALTLKIFYHYNYNLDSRRRHTFGEVSVIVEMSFSGATFKTKAVSEVISQHFKDEKVTVKGSALVLVTELLRIFTKEALSRAADQAKNEGDQRVTIEHLEKVLPQLV
ncbi:unnamed protein product, partial [Lymnaea stagnalis]